MALGRLRLWDGTTWTDRTQPQPPAIRTDAERRRGRHRTTLIDGITVMVVLVFVLGLVEVGWRKSSGAPPADATATLAVIQRSPTGPPGPATSVDVITSPSPPVADPGTTVAASPNTVTPPSILSWTPAPTLPPPTMPPSTVPSPLVPPATRESSQRFFSSPHDYTLTGYEWKPCQPITVSSAGPDVSDVVAELVSITGLPLQMVSGSANIMVGWGAMPVPNAIGVTQGTANGVLFAHVTITLAPRGASSLASLIRHEMGHALGLGHASQPNEVMYPVLRSDAPNDYQAGDRAGLHFIGASATAC